MSIQLKQSTTIKWTECVSTGDTVTLQLSEDTVHAMGRYYAALARDCGKVDAIKALRAQFIDEATGKSNFPLGVAKAFIEYYM